MRRIPLLLALVSGLLVLPGVDLATDLDQALCESWTGTWDVTTDGLFGDCGVTAPVQVTLVDPTRR